ncbi:hypothetical protein E3T46_17485 [Cryobacterium sp. Hh11]|uniref:hypothetical protein n=1 Tax=Cryobacterium sp. Hh11 TaxID=2555868 RepID=UPI00106941F0|nr:hypothetical protein [Cryobacterium sp. Hh11]TFD47584.1 hypothetical protein E3T46_17485 [Cryobacterium sp. Hh11]
MGATDDREMLEVAKEECGRLEREVAALKLTAAEDLRYVRRIEGENVDLLLTLTEPKPADVLVEGNYFAVLDLPAILGNFIRLNDENSAAIKRGWLHTERIKVERDKALAERDASREVNAEFLAARAESPTTVEWGVRRDEDTAQHSRAAAERTIAIQRKRKMKTVLIERNVGPWEVVQS